MRSVRPWPWATRAVGGTLLTGGGRRRRFRVGPSPAAPTGATPSRRRVGGRGVRLRAGARRGRLSGSWTGGRRRGGSRWRRRCGGSRRRHDRAGGGRVRGRGGGRRGHGSSRRGSWSDRHELAGLPRMGQLQDRGVLQEQVGVAAAPADPCPHGELAFRAKRQGPAPTGPSLEIVRPDEIGCTAIRAEGSHDVTLPTR